MKDQIELPPLPEARIVSYQTDSTMRSMELRTHSDEDMRDYARAAIEPYAKRIAELEAYRQRRGEPMTPEGFRLVAVNETFDSLVFWLERCEQKGHLENCSDLVEPWEKFEYLEVDAPQPAEPCVAPVSGKPICGAQNADQAPQVAEPVKMLSDAEDDIVDLLSEHADHNTEHGRMSFDKWALREAVSALIARNGQPAQPVVPDWPTINDAIAKRFPDDPANAARAQAAISDVLPAASAATREQAVSTWNMRAGQEQCPICAEYEPRTGRCGSDDPRALCNRVAPVAQEPVMRVRVAHSQGEVLDPVIEHTSDWFDKLPGGTIVELYAAPVAAQPSVPDGYSLVPTEILNRFPELNPSNYDHDDACAVNAWGVEVVLAATPTPPADKEAK